MGYLPQPNPFNPCLISSLPTAWYLSRRTLPFHLLYLRNRVSSDHTPVLATTLNNSSAVHLNCHHPLLPSSEY
nr:hypothetical protein [Tanacetum cinerariifolium]